MRGGEELIIFLYSKSTHLEIYIYKLIKHFLCFISLSRHHDSPSIKRQIPQFHRNIEARRR